VGIAAYFDTDVMLNWEGLSLRVQNAIELAAYKRFHSFEGDEAKHLADAAAAERWAALRAR
jgi:hypothetical protein